MTTRYYKLEDEKILSAFSEYYSERQSLQDKGNTLGKKFNLGDAGFKYIGMWGLYLAGFECTRSEHNNLADKELWTLPKDGYTRPKVKKGSEPYNQFKKACEELAIDGSKIEELIGFNHMDFFPAQPGYRYRGKENSMIFLMPESCDSVKGCIEITNIEYIKEAA